MGRVTSSSSAGNVSISDGFGNPLSSTDGALDVNVVTGGGNVFTPRYVYNEITNVVVGTETTIASFTATSIIGTWLQLVQSSGQNVGEVRIYVNSSIVDKQYLYYTQYNLDFDFKTDIGGVPGLSLSAGDIVTVKGLNSSPSMNTCNFNAKIQLVEGI